MKFLYNLTTFLFFAVGGAGLIVMLLIPDLPIWICGLFLVIQLALSEVMDWFSCNFVFTVNFYDDDEE